MKRKNLLSLLLSLSILAGLGAVSSPQRAEASEKKTTAAKEEKTTKDTEKDPEETTSEEEETTEKEKDNKETTTEKEKETDKDKEETTTEKDNKDKKDGEADYKDKYLVQEFEKTFGSDFFDKAWSESEKGMKDFGAEHHSTFEETYIYFNWDDVENYVTLLPIKGTSEVEYSYGFSFWIKDPKELDSPEGKNLIDTALSRYDKLVDFDREKALNLITEVTGDVSKLKNPRTFKDKTTDMDVHVTKKENYYDLNVTIYSKKDVPYQDIIDSFEEEFGPVGYSYFSDRYDISSKDNYYLYTVASLDRSLAMIDERMAGIYFDKDDEIAEQSEKLAANFADEVGMDVKEIKEAAEKFASDKEKAEIKGEKYRVEFDTYGDKNDKYFILITTYYDNKIGDFQDIDYINRYLGD